MAYPQRNLVDQIWKDRPSKSAAPIYMHELRFAGTPFFAFHACVVFWMLSLNLVVAGEHASDKLRKLRDWLREYPVPAADLKYTATTPRVPSPPHPTRRATTDGERPVSKPLPDLPPPSRTPSRQNSTSSRKGAPSPLRPARHNSTSSREGVVRLIPHYSTFVSSLSSIAWLLNLRGGDVPHNPLFHSYLWIGVDKATLFVDARKLNDDVKSYLRELRVSIKEVSEVWGYLRKREFGSGKVSHKGLIGLERY